MKSNEYCERTTASPPRELSLDQGLRFKDIPLGPPVEPLTRSNIIDQLLERVCYMRRVALVTGAGRGVGRAIALALAEDGIDVAVNYRRDVAAADDVVEAAVALGVDSYAVKGAVDDPDARAAVVADVLGRSGRVDILVNNAGNASRGNDVLGTEQPELMSLMNVHAFAAHQLCRAVLPGMRERGTGHIVFISSTATLHNPANGAPYNMAKAAVEALALTLSKEERPHGIRVNIVAPGLVMTDMGRRLVKATLGITQMEELDQTMPFCRVCRPEDVAGAVRWLVSPAASYVTGEKINVHAGG